MVWKIDGKTAIPPFVMARGDEVGTHELRIAHHESGTPWDFPVTLDVMSEYPNIVLINAVDRGGLDNKPASKYLCYSCNDRNRIITASLFYKFVGPVIVKAWSEEKRGLLENIDFEHFGILSENNPQTLIDRHLERIAGRSVVTDGIRDSAERTYFDMLWNIREFYGIYGGPIPELPTLVERAKVA